MNLSTLVPQLANPMVKKREKKILAKEQKKQKLYEEVK